jgi:hypothetical protein
MLLVVTPDMDAFNAFADAEQRYETRFVKKRRKFTPALPLEAARRAERECPESEIRNRLGQEPGEFRIRPGH